MAYTLIDRVINVNHYYRDLIYYFLCAIYIDKATLRDFLRDFIPTETLNNIRNKFVQFLTLHSITSIPITRNKHQAEFTANAKDIFRFLLDSKRPDEAFYFMVRCQVIPNFPLSQIAREAKTPSEAALHSYLLLTSYIKCLQQFISQNYYPTFTFFKSKFETLMDRQTRMDIIKDINIAMSRMKEKCSEFRDQSRKAIEINTSPTKLKDKHRNSIGVEEEFNSEVNLATSMFDELKAYYYDYMKFIQEDPVITLTEEDEQLWIRKVERFAEMENSQHNMEEEDAKEQLRNNKDRLMELENNVQQQSRVGSDVLLTEAQQDKCMNRFNQTLSQMFQMSYG